MPAQSFMEADKLDITEKEREALIKVLGMLERGELKHSPLPIGELQEPDDLSELAFSGLFNMVTYAATGSCGTVACLAGTSDILFGTTFVWDSPKDPMLYRLFHCIDVCDMDSITPAQAAAALRNYLTLGDARWEDVVSD